MSRGSPPRTRFPIAGSRLRSAELKSANERLVSVYEEVQSINEELKTSKEEQQSVNEELFTVNAELNEKVEARSRILVISTICVLVRISCRGK
jgi:chromosome segregation ATPase